MTCVVVSVRVPRGNAAGPKVCRGDALIAPTPSSSARNEAAGPAISSLRNDFSLGAGRAVARAGRGGVIWGAVLDARRHSGRVHPQLRQATETPLTDSPPRSPRARPPSGSAKPWPSRGCCRRGQGRRGPSFFVSRWPRVTVSPPSLPFPFPPWKEGGGGGKGGGGREVSRARKKSFQTNGRDGSQHFPGRGGARLSSRRASRCPGPRVRGSQRLPPSRRHQLPFRRPPSPSSLFSL